MKKKPKWRFFLSAKRSYIIFFCSTRTLNQTILRFNWSDAKSVEGAFDSMYAHFIVCFASFNIEYSDFWSHSFSPIPLYFIAHMCNKKKTKPCSICSWLHNCLKFCFYSHSQNFLNWFSRVECVHHQKIQSHSMCIHSYSMNRIHPIFASICGFYFRLSVWSHF